MLSQALMDQLAAEAMRMYGETLEDITYLARATPVAAPVGYICQAKCRAYRAQELTTDAMSHTDQECRIATMFVVWQPGHFDQIVRADGTTWLVQSWSGGPGHPWWKFQLRQVA